MSPLDSDPQFPDAFLLVLNPDGTFADDLDIGPDTPGTNNTAAGYAIAVDPAGDTVVIGGYFQGNILDTDGVTLGSPGLDLTSQAEDADAFIAAYNVKTNAAKGTTTLAYDFAADLTNGGEDSIVRAITFDGDGDINAAGSYRTDNTSTTSAFNTVNLDFTGMTDPVSSVTGEDDAFITQVEVDTGNWLNSDTFGSTGGAKIYALAADSSGDVYATGTFAGTADIGNNDQQLSSKDGNTDGFIVEYDQGLNAEFVNRFGNVDDVSGIALEEATGLLHVVGDFSGPANYGDVNSAAVLTPESDKENLYDLDIDATTGALLNSYAIGGTNGDTKANGVAFSDGSGTSDGTTALTIVGSYQGETNFGAATPAPLTGGGLNAFFAQASFTPVTTTGSAITGTSPTSITYGAAMTTVSGHINKGATGSVTITLDNVIENATITAAGAFSAAFPTATLGVGASPYTITYEYPGDTSFAAIGTTSMLTVTQAVPNVLWATPAPITPSTALGSAQLDATTTPTVAGSFAYTPAAGTMLSAGTNQALSVTFTPTDSIDYTTGTRTTKINVTAPTPTFSMLSAPSITYGTATVTVSGVIAPRVRRSIPSGGVAIVLNGTLANAAINSTTGRLLLSSLHNLDSWASRPPRSTRSRTVTRRARASSRPVATPPNLTVNKATPTTSPGATPAEHHLRHRGWARAQLDATASVPGTFTYTPGAGYPPCPRASRP